MTADNKFNFILIVVLTLTISLGCNQFGSSDADGTADGTNANSQNESSDDELALEITDENSEPAADGESEPEPVTSSGSNRTVVKFGKGKTSAAYNNAVIRGEQHTYVLGASAGQNMTVSISSTEDNAGFYILSPKEFFVGDGTDEDSVTRFNGTLPESGNYKIVVAPSRGNATYKINFAVSAKETAPPPPNEGGGSTTVVKFGKGKSSASYSNAVIRGERDTYILGASGGQTMSVSISSLEDNAVFDVVSPGGSLLASERTGWSGNLPQDGKYRIVVGGTRGNATYKVSFSIR
jgi:hypothetical protein